MGKSAAICFSFEENPSFLADFSSCFWFSTGIYIFLFILLDYWALKSVLIASAISSSKTVSAPFSLFPFGTEIKCTLNGLTVSSHLLTSLLYFPYFCLYFTSFCYPHLLLYKFTYVISNLLLNQFNFNIGHYLFWFYKFCLVLLKILSHFIVYSSLARFLMLAFNFISTVNIIFYF